MFQKDTNRNNDTSKKRLWQVFLTIIEQKADSTQKAGAHCAPVIGIHAKSRICSFTVFNKKTARRINCKKRGKMTLKGKFAGIEIEMCKVDEEQR